MTAFSYDGTVVQAHTVQSTGDHHIAADGAHGGESSFASGTRIRTLRGDVAVERLRVGDLVVTASGAHRPIAWLGQRTLDVRRSANREDILPVRIAAGAFGPDRPARDLHVSRGQAVCVSAFDEVLIQSSALINGATIAPVDRDEVTYWRVELDSHDVLLANGLPAESAIGPDNGTKTLEESCRPFFDGGPLVDAVRDRLRDRAQALGWSRDADTRGGLHLVADGVRIEADTSGLTARFLVPADTRDVWLVSGASVPYETGDGVDRRSLGVCVGSLTIDDGLGLHRTVAVDDPRLDAGFHPVEGGTFRWTDGRAKLSPDLWTGSRGRFFLRVDLAKASPARWVAPASTRTACVDPHDATRRFGRIIAVAIRDSVASARR